ncbi:hypothetical protein [Sorangium sp. So ce861]|uniref:hypothetical protein n=1 Tax=Sorangium sp. So ce861 TaxID=3133323 RepID=UPI003F626EB2
MLIEHVTAESDMIVRLPDGEYEGCAIIVGGGPHGTLVKIMMAQPIPIGGIEKHMNGCDVVAQTFEQAATELLEKVAQYRKSNGFKADPGLSRVDVRPKDAQLIRLRLRDGTAVDVPSWTKAISVATDGKRDSLRDGPQYMDADAIRAFEHISSSIDQYVGKAVVYRPSRDADFVVNALVEGALEAADA